MIVEQKAIEIVNELIPLAAQAYPPRSHTGSCGPESGCDGACMDIAHIRQTIARAERFVKAMKAIIEMDESR